MKPTVNRGRFYILRVLLFVAVGAFAFAAGYLVRSHTGRDKAKTEIKMPLSDTVVPETQVEYTCSMHPQIRQPGPGQCPICHMDLIPVEADTGMSQREYVLSESAKNPSGIEVAEVERRRHLVLPALLKLASSCSGFNSSSISNRITRFSSTLANPEM